jgi:hypothetical protein
LQRLHPLASGRKQRPLNLGLFDENATYTCALGYTWVFCRRFSGPGYRGYGDPRHDQHGGSVLITYGKEQATWAKSGTGFQPVGGMGFQPIDRGIEDAA